MDTGFSDRDLVAMATRDAASILGWSKVLGSIRPGARADLIVLDGTSTDPYKALVDATETAIVARRDQRRAALRHHDAHDAAGRVGRTRHHRRPPANALHGPAIGRRGCCRNLARDKRSERSSTPCAGCRRWRRPRKRQKGTGAGDGGSAPRPGPPVWFLALDELESTGSELRPRLPGSQGARHRAAPRSAGRARRPALPTRHADDARSRSPSPTTTTSSTASPRRRCCLRTFGSKLKGHVLRRRSAALSDVH